MGNISKSDEELTSPLPTIIQGKIITANGNSTEDLVTENKPIINGVVPVDSLTESEIRERKGMMNGNGAAPALESQSQNHKQEDKGKEEEDVGHRRQFKINKLYTFGLVFMHCLGIYGITIVANEPWQWKTVLFGYMMTWFGSFGVTAGAHRHWSHRAFKATLPLRILMIIMNTVAGQEAVWFWVANHRIHHKHSDTEKDPHNSTRGFWFSHIGWLMTFDHERLERDLKPFDISDINNDWLVLLQKKFYWGWVIIFSFIIPTWIPMYFWGETFGASYFIGTCWRYLYTLHGTLSINSFAHMFGSKPYDKALAPAENKWVSIFILGEGWHNFHHAFPWDYRASEYGFYRFNPSAGFIDLMAWLGLAYDLKTVSDKHIKQRAVRTGDGSYAPHSSQIDAQRDVPDHSHGHDTAWGWGDKDIPKENILATEILYPSKQQITG